MRAVVFAGPTIDASEVRAAGDFTCLPPAAQGDVFRAAQARPPAIGLVDGYFEGVPSVWHKEILFAMAEGVHVFGSASMGALRAAELEAFGMRGVGRIFEAYRDGACEDDDEVAVLHGPAGAGYAALSEPMVNIRATLERAVDVDVLGSATSRALISIAKALFYQDRSWSALLARPEAARLPAAELDALRDWLPEGRVDLKHADARMMLASMRTLLADSPPPMQIGYHFEWTTAWDAVACLAPAARSTSGDDGGGVLRARLLDEARLEAELFAEARRSAVLRLLVRREANQRRRRPRRGALASTATRFRSAHGLFTQRDVERWLEANDMDPAALDGVLADEANLEALMAELEPALDWELIDHLRIRGEYARLAERAQHKEERLAALGLDDPDPRLVGPTPAEIRLWYFEQRLARSMPDDVDEFARCAGFSSRADFDRALLREYLYCSHLEHDA